MLPILFNTEMVKAILEGRKTVTRRIVRGYDIEKLLNSPLHKLCQEVSDIQFINNLCLPPYRTGDILYVRETWQCWRAHRYEANADIIFKAGGEGVRLEFANGNTDSIDRFDYDRFVNKWFSHNGEWKPSIHMPKEVARLFLRVTGVRAERLRDITIEEIRKEGLPSMAVHSGDKEIAYMEWQLLWDSTINKGDLGKYGWDVNPYVWVIEFERCEKPKEDK